MNFEELLKRINVSTKKMDLVSARRYIEGNFDLLSSNKHRLRNNARALFDFIESESKSEIKPLSRMELNIVYSINSYASNFDVRGLKTSIKNNPGLFLKEDVRYLLNEDAKTLLSGMNAI